MAPDQPVELTIDVLYSCHLCGLSDVTVSVRARRSEEDVIAWMEGTCIPATGADHARRSPTCHPQSLQNLKIPIDGAEWVGGPKVN